ncbi:F0F1 ATP synthase subunit A [Hymenobacter sp. BT664]|uniref:ATP synthase subunit a n=1 Tax=Hymenobacter montanus TaxID=2771359 RepID=A0A927GL82_9BACT|nr:F0F1 ATP synthase subunit A [Hymenobacter montanus]MBD2770245.1 F0F1 ATP synthase subunit A [Hymenobacter montanus]
MKHLLLALCFFFTLPSFAVQHETSAAEATQSENFDPGKVIMEHVADEHEWHFATLGNEHTGTHLTLPLPIIAYQPGKGLSVFSSSQFHHSADGTYNGLKIEEGHLVAEDGSKVYDFSITKNVASLMLSCLILILVFRAVAKGYRTRQGSAPKGAQSFLEPVVVFIRDEVAKKSIGPKYERYMPYLLTIFFFIWFNNLLGLTPGAANLSGNITVTFMLAVATLLITLFSSNKYYWAHIFRPPGVPLWLLPIIVPVEIVGIFIKPISLMVRLFANITAGHIIILSFISLIFLFKSIAVSPLSLGFGLFISMLELLVALLQAYIFTLLSAMYIGGAVEDHHDADYQMGYDDGSETTHVTH